MAHNLLKGKKGNIFGALDENSIAWKTALACHAEGAEDTSAGCIHCCGEILEEFHDGRLTDDLVWIELYAATQNFDRDRIALDAILLAAQPRLDDVTQERDELRRSAKRFAGRDVIERRPHLTRSGRFVDMRVE